MPKRHLFNDGALTPASARKWQSAREGDLRRSWRESARWGMSAAQSTVHTERGMDH